jgi:hypothetical protein
LHRSRLTTAVLVAACCVAAQPSRAWVYPEHRDIAVLAVQQLDPAHRAQLDALWKSALAGHDSRLCATVADASQGIHPQCLDWAAFSAIAGDHSCSSAEMGATVLQSQWILQVADAAARLKIELDKASVAAQALESSPESGPKFVGNVRRHLLDADVSARRDNALRDTDLRMQRADSLYATRAGSNNAHFLSPRPDVEMDVAQYEGYALAPGAELNALGVYAALHSDAMRKSALLADPKLADTERSQLAWAALLDEAFGLHFLEDTFSAGHIAGVWGDASQRKGTHDYYNQNGIEAHLWNHRDQPLLLMGDAYMRPEDRKVAAVAVAASLKELLDASSIQATAPQQPVASREPAAANVCSGHEMRELLGDPTLAAMPGRMVSDVLPKTPVPALNEGLGATPRFRAEFGKFIGLASSVDARVNSGGYAADQHQNSGIGGLDVSLRAGLGLAGVLGPSGDGLTYLSAGFRADSQSTSSFTKLETGQGGITAAIPARTGYSLRMRLPFALVPGDLLLLSPLYLFSPDAYRRLAISAVNGGVIPWQSGMATGIGRFQFVLGRELGVTFYGSGQSPDEIFVLGPPPQYTINLVQYHSTLFDMPVLEYRPFGAFSGNQSSRLLAQLFVDADVPSGVHVVGDTRQSVKLQTVWSVGLRLRIDWRYYP